MPNLICCMCLSGRGWSRTTRDRSHQIYSLARYPYGIPTHIIQLRFATLNRIYLECFITSVLKGLLHFWLTLTVRRFFQNFESKNLINSLTLFIYRIKAKPVGIPLRDITLAPFSPNTRDVIRTHEYRGMNTVP